jgi:D-alanine-D-alanine ligase-like ATP-grasp enzyme/Fe-S-cluster containining protein
MQKLPGLVPLITFDDCQACGACCTFTAAELDEAPLFDAAGAEQLKSAFPDVPTHRVGRFEQVQLSPLPSAPGRPRWRCPLYQTDTGTCGAQDFKPVNCQAYPVLAVRHHGRLTAAVAKVCPALSSPRADTPEGRETMAAVAGALLTAAEADPELVIPFRESEMTEVGPERGPAEAPRPSRKRPHGKKLVLALNRQVTTDEDQYEFAPPDGEDALVAALGTEYDVRVIDCGRKIGDWVTSLQSYAPDLIYNIAAGYSSPAREAFFPALYEQLAMTYTGSNATALLLSHNKQFAKRIVHMAGVSEVRSALVAHDADLKAAIEWTGLPLIVKPNAEGSSIGIAADSICRDHASVARCAGRLWRQFRSPVMLEAFIPAGKDMSMTYIEGLGKTTFGPVHYNYSGSEILDGLVKNTKHEPSILNLDHGLSAATVDRLHEQTSAAVMATGMRGYARVDFRIAADGMIYFIEINGQPIWKPERSDFLMPVLAQGFGFREIALHIAAQAQRDRYAGASIAGLGFV